MHIYRCAIIPGCVQHGWRICRLRRQLAYKLITEIYICVGLNGIICRVSYFRGGEFKPAFIGLAAEYIAVGNAAYHDRCNRYQKQQDYYNIRGTESYLAFFGSCRAGALIVFHFEPPVSVMLMQLPVPSKPGRLIPYSAPIAMRRPLTVYPRELS